MARKIRVYWLPAAIVAIALYSPISEADVLYSTFAPGDVFPTGSGMGIESGQWVANPFTVAGNDYWFDQLEFAAQYWYGANQFDVSVRADAAGLPGARLESFSVSFPVSTAAKISVDSITHPLLQNGGAYWVVLGPESDGMGFWPDNNAIIGTIAYGVDPNFTSQEGLYANVFRVHGSVVPEPSVFLLVLAGLGGLGGVLRSRRLRRAHLEPA